MIVTNEKTELILFLLLATAIISALQKGDENIFDIRFEEYQTLEQIAQYLEKWKFSYSDKNRILNNYKDKKSTMKVLNIIVKKY